MLRGGHGGDRQKKTNQNGLVIVCIFLLFRIAVEVLPLQEE